MDPTAVTQQDAYMANEATKRLRLGNWVLIEIARNRFSYKLFNIERRSYLFFKSSYILLDFNILFHIC